MDAAVADELLERESSHLAPHRVEAGDDDGVRGVVDDDVDARGELERADVSSLAPDDAPLHLVVRQRDRGDGGLGGVLGGDPLNGQRYDLLRLALGVAAGALANLADPVRGLGLRLLLHPLHELVSCVDRRHPRERLQPAPLLTDHLVQLLLPVGDQLLLSANLTRAPPELLVALIEHVDLPVERDLPLLYAPLLPVDLVPPLPCLRLPSLA